MASSAKLQMGGQVIFLDADHMLMGLVVMIGWKLQMQTF